jgi:hypothetical protein
VANTWRATSQAVAFASGKSMIDVFNAAASTRFIRAYRLYQFNNGTAAVAGVLTTMRVETITTATVGTLITPVAHDTGNAALNANTTAGTGQTAAVQSLFRQYLWSNDEPTVSLATMDEWELLVPFAEVWNAGYGDTAIQALTCPAATARGVQIRQSGVSAVGSNDFEIEFTDAAA